MPAIPVGNPSNLRPVDRVPDQCPMCHRSVTPDFKFSHVVPRAGLPHGRVSNVYACPSDACMQLFISHFNENPAGGMGTYNFIMSVPKTPVNPMVFKGIAETSPSFVEIYTQALHAEGLGLDQIAGVGLRKSLEFLVKDYCSAERPSDAENIKRIQLGPCIENYVSDQNIKECAKLASWLGNDETHYVRKWVDRDITDLKDLLGLTMSWIETSLKTKAYKASMLSREP